LTSCRSLPPTATLNPPTVRAVSVDATAWIKKVEITDAELENQSTRGSVENTLTNNLLRYLREGKFYKKVELLPGQPEHEDHILHFQFDRYRQKRLFKLFTQFDASELSCTLTIIRPNGQLLKKVAAEIKEEHPFDPYSPEAALPSGMKARTDLIEELLRKALPERSTAE
jgi:hypothetical protein